MNKSLLTVEHALPPGQFLLESFPRFGLLAYAKRLPRLGNMSDSSGGTAIRVYGDGVPPFYLDAGFAALPRVEQWSDFHCVTSWSQTGLQWEGVRFSDVYEKLVSPLSAAARQCRFVVIYGLDGYRSILPLEDLLASDVLLADRLHGESLNLAHGAPLRLVAPAHYGYKSVKHICAIEFLHECQKYRPVGYRFMAHPRARVQAEERGLGLPGVVFRWLYRPLIGFVIRRFAKTSV